MRLRGVASLRLPGRANVLTHRIRWRSIMLTSLLLSLSSPILAVALLPASFVKT
jgi:hypothetical protein